MGFADNRVGQPDGIRHGCGAVLAGLIYAEQKFVAQKWGYRAVRILYDPASGIVDAFDG
jgi:hypothetical protein